VWGFDRNSGRITVTTRVVLTLNLWGFDRANI